MFARGALALVAVSVIGALASPVVVTYTDASITSAATTVSAGSSAGAALFPFEIVQLIDETLKIAAASRAPATTPKLRRSEPKIVVHARPSQVM
jgi:hypothetical protein